MPILHILAGPNGSGKSSFVDRALQPITHLQFVNADIIALERWPEPPALQVEHAYDASSKLDLLHEAQSLGYLVHLQAIMLPVDVAVARVSERVQHGGHDVPEQNPRSSRPPLGLRGKRA